MRALQVDGKEVCKACDFGFFKDRQANDECTACPMEHATTFVMGSTSIDQCVCSRDYYRIDDGEPRCELCESTHHDGPLGTACKSAGITLDRLPISPGFWRQGNASQVVRACKRADACTGGDIVSDEMQCVDSQAGPLCSVCREGYHQGGGEGPCQLCSGDPVLAVAIPVAGFLALLALALFLAVSGKKRRLDQLAKLGGVAVVAVSKGGGRKKVGKAVTAASKKMIKAEIKGAANKSAINLKKEATRARMGMRHETVLQRVKRKVKAGLLAAFLVLFAMQTKLKCARLLWRDA